MTLLYYRSNGGLMAKSESVSVRFPVELLGRVDLACAGRSRSQFVLDAVRAALGPASAVAGEVGARQAVRAVARPLRAVEAPAGPRAGSDGLGVRWAVTPSPLLERFKD